MSALIFRGVHLLEKANFVDLGVSRFWSLVYDLLLSERSCKIGIAKAAVFHVPVWAHQRKSLPVKIIGIASFWIGVGQSYHSSVMARNIGSAIGNSLNSIE